MRSSAGSAPTFLVAALLAGAPLLACTGAGAGRDPDPGIPFQAPNAVSGGTRGGGRPASPSLERQREAEDKARVEAEAKAATAEAARQKKSEDLWENAHRLEARDPDDAADAYHEIAEKYRDSPHAGEARWREALMRHADGDAPATVRAIRSYLDENPVNVHAAEAEEMLFDAAPRILDGARGFKGIFKSDKTGIEAYQLIVDRLPEGRLADDSLLALGDEYSRRKEWMLAALHYQHLLLRYPNSEWSFRARLRLGDVYLARDQGAEYHAGFVDLDPRTNPDLKQPQVLASRPVRSCVAAALQQYEAFLDRIAADPARRAEYAQDVEYARDKASECRARLAEKDQVTAAYYGSRGSGDAADAYRRYADNIERGVAWSEGVPAPPTVVPSPDAPRPLGPASPADRGMVPASPPSAPPQPVPPPPSPPPSPPVATTNPPPPRVPVKPHPTTAPTVSSPTVSPPTAPAASRTPPSATMPSRTGAPVVPPSVLPPPVHIPGRS